MKTILITGASSGIGKAVAQTFADKGWNVVATMRDPSAGADLTARENVLVTRLDVKDPASVDAAIKAGIERFGAIDMLLNNAGTNLFGAFEEFSPARVQGLFDVNVFGVMDVTRAILPHFRARRQGVLVNLSSLAGLFTFPLGALYDATKFALEGFSEALAYELLPLGIVVKLVEPGLVRTAMTARFEGDVPADEAIADYADFSAHTFRLFETMMAGDVPEASVVAERIYAGVTDGTDRLRYRVTDDGGLMEAKRTMTDEAFVAQMRAAFMPPTA